MNPTLTSWDPWSIDSPLMSFGVSLPGDSVSSPLPCFAQASQINPHELLLTPESPANGSFLSTNRPQQQQQQQPADYLDVDVSYLTSPSPANTSSQFLSSSDEHKLLFSDGERSPSIGIPFSPLSRPSSQLTQFFCGQTASSDIVAPPTSPSVETVLATGCRLASVDKEIAATGASSECSINDEIRSVIESAGSDTHWTEWNIKLASGCPPLDKLFENKQRWRTQFNNSIPPDGQRHCVFCRSMKKQPSEYLSHNVRDETGKVTCPILGAYRCPTCGQKGHTVRYCTRGDRPDRSESSEDVHEAIRSSAAETGSLRNGNRKSSGSSNHYKANNSRKPAPNGSSRRRSSGRKLSSCV